MEQRRLPMRGRQLANYEFESWRMRGVNNLETIRTVAYFHCEQFASVLGSCGTENALKQPQRNSHFQEEYRALFALLESESR